MLFIYLFLGEKCERASKSSRDPPRCSERSVGLSVLQPCGYKPHLRSQTAEGNKHLDTFTYSTANLSRHFIVGRKVMTLCLCFAVDRLCPG